MQAVTARATPDSLVPPATTSQRLGQLIKTCRDVMRKDKGLNGDLDRLPLLTWILFLKFLDDMERVREDEAALRAQRFTATIEAPYRWRDWNGRNEFGRSDDGIHNSLTGDALLAFINLDESKRPDGRTGLGLFRYLRSLQGGASGGDRRDVVATVFRGTANRMQSGYLLRDVLDKANEIHFSSSDEIHTLGHLYESMLKEMRDAAGDSGEFYTPRPLVRMIAAAIDPKPGQTILDPAAGTAGFLAEAFEHLKPQCATVEEMDELQRRTLHGIEAKPLPYLLAQMNLVLHGVETPDIDPGNALRYRMSEIGDGDRVDVIMTNPPFGGEEEKGIQNNFPQDMQTSETALLFLQFIMRKLKRAFPGQDGGRAAVIVPNGTLYEKGVAARIREQLVTKFNLQTVLRLPKGVFEPYTDIATNVLFFASGGPTNTVWFYDHPLPDHRRHLKGAAYSATDSLQFSEFAPFLSWWKQRHETECAFQMSVDELANTGYDLAQTNPRRASIRVQDPVSLLQGMRVTSTRLGSTITALEQIVGELRESASAAVPLRAVLRARVDRVRIDDDATYTRPRVQLHFRGARIRDAVPGRDIGSRNQTLVRAGDLIVSRIDARNGAMAILPEELDGAIATNDFPVFEIATDRIWPAYLRYALFHPSMVDVYGRLSRGSTNRRRLEVSAFLALLIPLPTLEEQTKIAAQLECCEKLIASTNAELTELMESAENVLAAAMHVATPIRNGTG